MKYFVYAFIGNNINDWTLYKVTYNIDDALDSLDNIIKTYGKGKIIYEKIA